jgi:hypothetical protein
VNGLSNIPLTGFEPSHHLARPTFDDFATTILPLRFRALTEHAGYTRMGSMCGRLSRRQMVRTPHTDSQGGARANLAMSGAARCDISTEARALQAIPPAIGTLIGHFTGRVIWDISKPLAANSRNPQSLTQRSVQRDYAFHLLPGLGFGDVGNWRRGFRDGVHAVFGNAGARER